MKLVYFHGKEPNFGDDINAVLWPRLLPGRFDGLGDQGFLGIGTLIGMATPGCRRLDVFSTGAGYDAIDTWRIDRRIWCVRGPLTARLLGLEPELALTDGAILLPEIFPAPCRPPASGTVGVVPHWQSLSFPGWALACAQAGYRLISPIDTPENVHAAIGGVELVLTESLHGAILADIMGIPWLPFVSTRNVSALKWVDWCLSVGVEFAPQPVPPPSAAAALTYGRPGGGRLAPLRLDAESALAEFRSRVTMGARPPLTPDLASRARNVLRGASRRSAWLSRAIGYGPARTADHLTRLARASPTLSRDSRRADLRSAMLERLRAFELTHIAAPLASLMV